MSSGNLSNRQKMINMMYLVLIAMLALNVSAEILKAFHLVETGMNATGEALDARNVSIMQSFEEGMKYDPERTRPFYVKARNVNHLAGSSIQKIEELKQELIAATDGREEEGDNMGELKGRDNMEKHAYLMVSEQGPHKAQWLRKLMKETHDGLLAVLPEEQRIRVKVSGDLVVKDPAGKTWQAVMFERTPLAAVVTILKKIQNDIRMTEIEVVDQLSRNIYRDVQMVDRLDAIVQAKSGVVAVGENFEADIFLAASNSTLAPEIYMNGKPLEVVDGKAHIKMPATPGNHEFSGSIKIKSQSGKETILPFQSNYVGFAGMAAISPDAMNVLYAGPDNPVTVTVAGFPPENVMVSGKNCTLKKVGNGKFMVQVGPQAIATGAVICASVKTSSGTIKPMGETTFRVRRVLPPNLSIGGYSSGKIKKQELFRLRNLSLISDPSNVFQGCQYKCESAVIGIYSNREGYMEYPMIGESLSSDLVAKIQKLGKGDFVSIYNVVYSSSGVKDKLRSGLQLVVEK